MKIYRWWETPPEFWQNFGLHELSPEELKEAYALAKAAFTVEDLVGYTELEEGVPADEVLAELEEAQKQFEKKSE